jgi:hypothetical protein
MWKNNFFYKCYQKHIEKCKILDEQEKESYIKHCNEYNEYKKSCPYDKSYRSKYLETMHNCYKSRNSERITRNMKWFPFFKDD